MKILCFILCAGIICMTCPVNLSTFTHHKESGVIIQYFNTLLYIVR